MNPVYLDYNATTPIDPAVAEAMLPFIHHHFGNPSSGHAYGQRARQAVEEARHEVAALLGCHDDEIVFTSGGTEANNYAIKGIAGLAGPGSHIITSAVEHPAVIEVCRFLSGSTPLPTALGQVTEIGPESGASQTKTRGCSVTYLPVDEHGMVTARQIADAITDRTVLVTIMHANNEVGTIEPIREIADAAHARGIPVHADCAQSVGKIPVNVDDLGVDLLSIAGHKLYAPKGVGALYVRRGVALEKLMHGADHENNWRAGTENVILIAGLGQACRLIRDNLVSYQAHMETMRDRLETALREAFPDLRINGHPEHRLPNTSSVSFPGAEANHILDQLEGVAASAGAACHSDRVELSSVLEAMRVPLEYAKGTIRLSVGRYTTPDEIDRATAEIVRVVTSQIPSLAAS